MSAKKSKRARSPFDRYSAKLLFQLRVANEAGSEIRRMRAPMERRAALIPPKRELPVFRLAARSRGKGKGG